MNGTPILADCAIEHAEAYNVDVQAALGACIDFELLASEAIRRGFDSHPAAHTARKTESVRKFIDVAFVSNFNSPDDVPMEHVRHSYERTKYQWVHPEIRFTVYVRARVNKKAPRGSPEDLKAKQLIYEIHESMRGKLFKTKETFYAAAQKVARGRPLENGKPFDFPRHGRAVEEYAKPAFDIPKVGAISVPTRTRWGWDIILFTGFMRPQNLSVEQAASKIRPVIYALSRERSFEDWAKTLEQKRDIKIFESPLTYLSTIDPYFLSQQSE